MLRHLRAVRPDPRARRADGLRLHVADQPDELPAHYLACVHNVPGTGKSLSRTIFTDGVSIETKLIT